MAEEMEIIIDQHDLGRPEREFGISESDLTLFDDQEEIRVNVFVDGERATLTKAGGRERPPAEAKEKSPEDSGAKSKPRAAEKSQPEAAEKSIIAKVSGRHYEDMLTVVVTTKHDKIINVLIYDPKEKQFWNSAGEPEDEGALINSIGAAAQAIADAMGQIGAPIRTR